MDRNEIKYEMFEELKIHRNMNMLELDNEQCLDIARFMSKIAVNQLKNNGGLGDVVGQSEQFNCFLEDSEQGERCESKCKDCKDYKGVRN